MSIEKIKDRGFLTDTPPPPPLPEVPAIVEYVEADSQILKTPAEVFEDFKTNFDDIAGPVADAIEAASKADEINETITALNEDIPVGDGDRESVRKTDIAPPPEIYNEMNFTNPVINNVQEIPQSVADKADKFLEITKMIEDGEPVPVATLQDYIEPISGAGDGDRNSTRNNELSIEPELLSEFPSNVEGVGGGSEISIDFDTVGELPLTDQTMTDLLNEAEALDIKPIEPVDDMIKMYELQRITDVPTLTETQEWLGDINPNYDPYDWESPYNNNCGSCAFAVSQRLEGDNEIVATANNIGTTEEMNAITGMEQISMSPDKIQEYLISQGPGAHGIVGIDRAEGPGHWFNAYYDGDKVVAIDGQTGEINGWPPDYGDVVNWDISVQKGA